MKLPIRSITNFVRSPKGQKMLREARTRLDTPENRRRVGDVVSRARPRPGGSGGTSRSGAGPQR